MRTAAALAGLLLASQLPSRPPDIPFRIHTIDPGASVRQVAMIDASGNVATHTGDKCIAHAGHCSGTAPDGAVYSAQANLMGPDTVPQAMADAFERSSGDLPGRILAALEAAQRAGGDIRGRQSAAILVVRGKPSGKPWN